MQLVDSKTLLKVKDSHFVHIVIIGTKPDIIKQSSIYHALVARGEKVVLCHSGQHYNYDFSGGAEKEFDLDVDIRLGIEGTWSEKTLQMIERFGSVLETFIQHHKIPIPYVHGDTATASAIAFAAMINKVSCVHVEAGIRTLTPTRDVYRKHLGRVEKNSFDWHEYFHDTQKQENYTFGSIEPFPEQMNTRMIEPTSGFCAVPLAMHQEQLLREGVDPSKIAVVGNTIADVTRQSLETTKTSDVFERHPFLTRGDFIVVSVHRRENVFNKKRLGVILESIELLLRDGYRILFLSRLSTEEAIDTLGYRTAIERLKKEYSERFMYSRAWAFHQDVVAALVKCSVVVADSGGLQEEANILGIPMVTVRFGSDRSETFFAGANIPAPPISGKFMSEVIKGACNNKHMRNVGNLYGEHVAEKIVEGVYARLVPETGLFLTEEQRLGFV